MTAAISQYPKNTNTTQSGFWNSTQLNGTVFL